MWRRRNLLALIFSGLAVSIGASCSSGGDGEKVELRLRLEKGESHRLRWTSDQKIQQTDESGQQESVQQSAGIGLTFDVQEVDPDGTATVKVTFHAITFEQDSALGKITYDSADPPETAHPLAMKFAVLLGESFTIGLTPEGKVTSLEGVDAMFARILEGMDAPFPGMRQILEKQLQGLIGGNGLKEMVENSLAVYPPESVAVGDSWNGTSVFSKGLPLTMENTWTLKTLEDDKAVLAVESKIYPNAQVGPVDMGFSQLRYEVSGTQQGEIEIDLKTGWPSRQRLTQELSGTMDTQAGPIAGKSYAVSIRSDIRVEPE